MIQAQTQSTVNGAILFDAAMQVKPTEAWFDAHYWLARGEAEHLQGGRGSIIFAQTPVGACVLRHYRRGGLIARLSADRYCWTGASRTRSFHEFQLLVRLNNAKLPVPKPVAAYYRHCRWYYTADLMTQRIPAAQTLAESLKLGVLDETFAIHIGQTLARFHALGVYHADLNAHNILRDEHGKVWLLDFDRGRIRRPALSWQQANLARLQRSLKKLGAFKHDMNFAADFWHPLLAAYHAALADNIVDIAQRIRL